MWGEIIDILRQWTMLDTWIVVTGALAAMSCALPGCFLLLRRQSMMGDALSHTSLLGVVLAFLFAYWLQHWRLLSQEGYEYVQHGFMVVGAMAIGILAAVLNEGVQKLGRVEASAALGVVFTVLFAAGLLLIRLVADRVHLDPDCVLYGAVETVYGGSGVPTAAILSGAVLLANLALTGIFFKELLATTFDPSFATAQGVDARVFHYALMAVTAASVVTAFESVGVILVVAMLVTPAATAHLLTDRLSLLLILSLAVAAASAVLGHAMAITLPAVIFSRLGFPTVQDASTAGMMAVAGGVLFTAAALFGPRYGIISRSLGRVRMSLRIVSEDILGALYRREELARATPASRVPTPVSAPPPSWRLSAAMWLMRFRGELERNVEGWQLTEAGRRRAEMLVRAHRLWESYVAKHFAIPGDHLHQPAARAEHYIGPELRSELARELAAPETDPHGRSIPDERNSSRGS